jgi:hypothetical protein
MFHSSWVFGFSVLLIRRPEKSITDFPDSETDPQIFDFVGKLSEIPFSLPKTGFQELGFLVFVVIKDFVDVIVLDLMPQSITHGGLHLVGDFHVRFLVVLVSLLS